MWKCPKIRVAAVRQRPLLPPAQVQVASSCHRGPTFLCSIRQRGRQIKTYPQHPPQEPSSSSSDATKGQQKSKRRISWADQEHKKPLSEIRYIDVVGKGQPLPKDKRDNPDSFQQQPESLDNCLEKIIKKEPPEKSAKPSTSKPISASSKTSSSVSNSKISGTNRAKVKPINDDDDDSSSSSSKAY